MNDTRRQPPSPALVLTLVTLLCLIWGSTWLVIKLGLRDVPPLSGAAIRFVIAGACMALLVKVVGDREPQGRPPWPAVVSQGLLQFAFNYAVVYVSETLIPSGLVSVLWAVFPLCVALASHFILKNRTVSRLQWLGMGIAFAGVATLFATDIATLDGAAIPMGLLVLLAPVSVTLPTLLIEKTAQHTNLLILSRDSMWLGAIVLLGLAALLEQGSPLRLTPLAVFSILYLAIPGTVFTFGVYLWLLRHVAAYRMSLISFVTPAVALLTGALFGGEPLTSTTIIGSGLVLGGVWLALSRARS